MSDSDALMVPSQAGGLRRELSGRHIQLISIGGCIGTGLFMGSGRSIAESGPSILFVYAVIGCMLFFVMRAMGELFLSNLSYRSFVDLAEDLLGPWAGFATGWSYWFAWVVTAIAELVAIAGYIAFWWPEFPPWVAAVAALAILLTINLLTVRAFGEVEFWFALIKIVAILGLIGLGVALVATGFVSPEGHVARFQNLWSYEGFFPKGIDGVVAGFRTAIFAFVGLEIVGTTCAEAKDPAKIMPKAINAIPIRILLFYLGTLLVLMTVTPWSEISPDHSPFVGMFTLVGMGFAASLVNGVVITSAMSSTNSGIYSTSRMLYGLSAHQDAALGFSRLSKHGVPVNALLFGGVFLAFAVVLLATTDNFMDAFQLVGAAATMLYLFIWTIILISYLVYRKRRPEVHRHCSFKMPLGRFMSVTVLMFFVFVLWALATDPKTQPAVLILPAWFLLLGLIYLTRIRTQPQHVIRRARHLEKVELERSLAKIYLKSESNA